jgi:molybdopterin-synthase adenylyltransferase
MTLAEAQVRRYARHVLLPDVGGRGQERLLGAAIAVPVGPRAAAEVAALIYLAAAGVGTLVVTGEPDGAVTAAEQSAGIAYGVTDVGRPRIEALRERVGAINPEVTVTLSPHPGAVLLSAAEPADDVASALIAGGNAAARTIARLLDQV